MSICELMHAFFLRKENCGEWNGMVCIYNSAVESESSY